MVLSISAVSVIVTLPTSAARSITFPGPASELTSPNGLYTIKNVDQPVGNGNEWNHNLFFKKKGQRKESILNPNNRVLSDAPGECSYNRSAEILWSPNSNAFALNDWMGSNVASAYLYHVRDLSHPIDLADKVYDALKDKRDQSAIANSDHVYTFANKWIGPTVLEIKEAGHGSGIAFTFYYHFDLRTNSCKFIKRLPDEDTQRDAN